MLDKFRSLPPFVRIVSVLLGLAVILGVIAILIAFFNAPASSPHPDKTAKGGPNPSISVPVTPRPTATPSASASPTPDASLQAQLNRPNDDATSSKRITDADRNNITTVAENGYLAWCTHDSHSAKTAQGVEDKYYAGLAKYYTKDSAAAQRGNYLTFIQDQVCEVHAGQPSKVLADGSVTYTLFASVATVYEDGTPAHEANKAYVSNPGATLYLKKTGGKWLIYRLVTVGASD
jgi:hypothetical protein